MDYINTLAEVADALDAKGLTKAADAVDTVLKTVAEVRQVTAQYESGLPYWVFNSRCWGNCYREKRSANPKKPAQEVWTDCLEEYNKMIEGDQSGWSKYASGEKHHEFSPEFLVGVNTKIASGVNAGMAINSELEDRIAEPLLKLIASAEVVTKVAAAVTDEELQTKLAHVAMEIIKEAQSRWQDWGNAIGRGVGALGGGLAGGAVGSLAGPAGMLAGGAAGMAGGAASSRMGNMGAAVGGKLENAFNAGKGMFNRMFRSNSPDAAIARTDQFTQYAVNQINKLLQTPHITDPHMAPQRALMSKQLYQQLAQRASKLPAAAKATAEQWLKTQYVPYTTQAFNNFKAQQQAGGPGAGGFGGGPQTPGTPSTPGAGQPMGPGPMPAQLAQNIAQQVGNQPTMLQQVIAELQKLVGGAQPQPGGPTP